MRCTQEARAVWQMGGGKFTSFFYEQQLEYWLCSFVQSYPTQHQTDNCLDDPVVMIDEFDSSLLPDWLKYCSDEEEDKKDFYGYMIVAGEDEKEMDNPDDEISEAWHQLYGNDEISESSFEGFQLEEVYV